MGRILKKKDPQKKKALRADKTNPESSGSSSSASAPAPKVVAVKRSADTVKPKTTAKGPSLFQKIVQFLLEVKIELKKVAWPSRKQTMGSTVVVIVLVFIISIFLGVVDFGLSSLIRVVLP